MPILGTRASSLQSLEKGSFESIATTTLASDTSSISFTSVPGTYKHLQLRFMAKGNNAGDLEYLGFRLNGFTGDYYWHQIYGEGSGTPTGTYFQQSFMRCFISGNNGANMFGVGITDILDYADTNKFKTLKTFSGYDLNGSGMATVCSGLYSSTSAVTSVTVLGSLYPTSGASDLSKDGGVNVSAAEVYAGCKPPSSVPLTRLPVLGVN